ncbi:hypothetical protein KP509_18G007200 [Ceratopteris richardii]|uniref:Uncharacterized protein n=1 Tax=Ceratopteris richardii TaxID=49495 RepID=A0A8T2SN30_CERRI|nr:hypothetical protein KP509_18G007200 [Ceratopteris richardii]
MIGETYINPWLKTRARDKLQVRGTFKPFEVVPNNGGSDLTLRRVTGKEETLIKCTIDIDNHGVEGHTKNASDKEGSGSDDIDDLRICQRLTMNVQIFKVPSEEENPRMAFLCSYTKGPYFPDLNDNLKEAFRNVIKARGINSSLANTIMEHLTNHYASEYVDWLKKTRQFLGR